MTYRYQFPIEIPIERNETLDHINDTFRQFGFGERLSLIANAGSITVNLTGKAEPGAAELLIIRQTLQKYIDELNKTDLKILIGEGRKL